MRSATSEPLFYTWGENAQSLTGIHTPHHFGSGPVEDVEQPQHVRSAGPASGNPLHFITSTLDDIWFHLFHFHSTPLHKWHDLRLLQQQKVTPNTWSQLVLRSKMSSWFCFFHYCTDCFSQFYSLWHFLRLILKKNWEVGKLYLFIVHTHTWYNKTFDL